MLNLWNYVEELGELNKSFAAGRNSENELKVRWHKVAVLRRHPLPRHVRRRLLFRSRRTHHRRRYPTRGAFGRAATFVNVLDHVFQLLRMFVFGSARRLLFIGTPRNKWVGVTQLTCSARRQSRLRALGRASVWWNLGESTWQKGRVFGTWGPRWRA